MNSSSKVRRFCLHRHEDETGISGTGIVCHGVQFPSGKCVMEWVTDKTSIGIYDSIDHVESIHGHQGKTEVVWVDEESKETPTAPPFEKKGRGLVLNKTKLKKEGE